MVSKCANPACSKRFLYLHQGKLFNLTPAPEVEAAGGVCACALRAIWLCDDCCQRLTLVWGGTEIKRVPLPRETDDDPASAANNPGPYRRSKRRAASAGLHWR